VIVAAAAPADVVGTSIVLVGPADPTVLQPSNLLKIGALTEADLTELQYEIFAPEVTVAKLSWVRAIVERDKFMFSTTPQAPAAEPVRDLLLSVVELQATTRFTALGINREQHFAVSSLEVWHDVGHRLVPKADLWSKILNQPGTLSVTVQGERDDGAKGKINLRIEPSIQIRPGIFVHINDHFDASADALETDPDHLLVHLTDGWSSSVRRFERIVAAVKEFAG
jgi:hypothetical protein